MVGAMRRTSVECKRGMEVREKRRTFYTRLLEPGEGVLEQRLVRDGQESLGRGLVTIVARQREKPAK